MKRPQARHVLSNTLRQWLVSASVFVALYFFFMWYHKVRGKDYSWFTTEKCIAIASVFCLGLALAIGPLSRFGRGFRKALPYRRSLGLTAAWMAVPHVLLSLFYLPFRFPDKYSGAGWYLSHWLTTAMGAMVLILLLAIALCSFPRAMKKLGKRKWMILQKLAYLVLILLVVHLLSLGKVPGWIKWLKTFDEPLPPGAFTTTAFCVLVLLLKVVDLIVHGDTLAAGRHADASS